MAETAGVAWVGDLSSRITDGALLDAFTQFGVVEQCGLLHDAFTGAPSHCGWVRFRDPGVVPTLLTTCNDDHLLCIGAGPRPVMLGTRLEDVLEAARDDALTRAQAQVGSQQQEPRRGSGGGDGSQGKVELLTQQALESRLREKRQAKELRKVLATHGLQKKQLADIKKSQLDGCAAGQQRQLQEELGKYSRLRQLVAKCDERAPRQ